MSQAQSRKQKILGDVKRKRQQRAIISVIFAIALIAIVVVAVIALTPKPNPVILPDYLSHCVNGSLYYHSHPNLTVTINGVNMPIANNSFNSSCSQPLHTHDASGVIHVETDQNRDYRLGDWFMLWGYFASNPTFTIFNNTQIFDHKVDATHRLTMTVNGTAVDGNTVQFASHVFPRNAAPTGGVGGGSGLCAVPTGQPCVEDNIVITYG